MENYIICLIYLFLATIWGFIIAEDAKRKGHRFFLWFIFGFVLGLFAYIALALSEKSKENNADVLEKEKNLTFKLAQMAMLVAISIVSLYVIPLWSIFPSAPYLQYDIADVPVLIGTMLFGPESGLLILGLVSVIQGLTISAGGGWVGIVMHFCASGALVLVSGLIYKKWKTVFSLIIGLMLGSLSMTAIMIPLNLFLTVRFYGVPYEAVKDLIVPVTIPFNLIKAGLNSVITAIVFSQLNKILKRMHIHK